MGPISDAKTGKSCTENLAALHPGLCEGVRLWLDAKLEERALPVRETVEKGHGRVETREPGIGMRTRTTQLDAYEALLLDVIEGDHSQFLRSDEVNWAWRVVDPVLKVWAVERDFIHTYPAGSWGPTEANRLFEKESQYWRNSLASE